MSAKPSAAHNDAIEVLCMRLAYEAMLSASITTSGAAVTVAWLLAQVSPAFPLIVWAALACVIGVVRLALVLRFRSRERTDAEVRAFMPIYTLVMGLAGANWGALIVVAGLSTSPFVNGIIIFVIGGMTAAGAQSLAMTPGVFRTSVLLSLTPICLHMLVSGDPLLRGFLILVVMHIGVVLSAVRTNNGAARAAIALRFENQDLVVLLTEKTKREEEAREQAEWANEEKSRFLAAASHDVRQPLHALGLFVDALQAEDMSEPAKRLVASIELAHSSLTSLHEGLLDISRLDAGAITANYAPVRAHELLARLSVEAGPRAAELNVGFKVIAADVTLWADAELLLRVLRNLVANAITYTPRGRVLVVARRRGPHALLQVWDTGAGIAPEEQERVFDELYQVENQARDREHGLGLGLAIVRRLATILGTEVSLRSTPGKGSVFQLLVPLSATPFAAPEPELATRSHVASGAIALVVDDDALARTALASTLTGWGYEVVVAQSAGEAEDYARDLPRLDLLVSDLWLPGRSGLEFATAHPGPTRVILSGDTNPQVADRVRAAGIAFVQKPVRAAQLWSALKLEGARPVEPSNSV